MSVQPGARVVDTIIVVQAYAISKVCTQWHCRLDPPLCPAVHVVLRVKTSDCCIGRLQQDQCKTKGLSVCCMPAGLLCLKIAAMQHKMSLFKVTSMCVVCLQVCYA